MATGELLLEELNAQATWLRRLAAALAGDGADDLVQETMLVAWRHAPERRESLRPWLHQVLTNLSRMRHRSEQQRIARQRSWARLMSSPADTPDELFDRHEGIRRLAAAVSALEEPFRSTVLLRYAEQRTTADIARLQGVPAGTVRWRLTEALKRLRAELGPRDDARRSWAVTWLLAGAALVLVGVAGWIRFEPQRSTARLNAASSSSKQSPRDRPPASNRPLASRPSFLPLERVPAIVNNPTSPGYDPLKLLEFAQGRRIFEAEPRTCSWAAAMEVRLERNILAELRVRVPEATIESLTCRHATCALALKLPPGTTSHRMGAAMIALQRPSLASGIHFPAADTSHPSRLPVYLLFAPAERDPAAYDRWYAAERSVMARVLSGPDTPPRNRPANPPARVLMADADPRDRTCRSEDRQPLAAPVEVPEQPSPLQVLLAERDQGAHAMKQSFQSLVQEKVRLCRRERSGWRDYARLRFRGWGEAAPARLTISRVSLEVAEGAPLPPALAACLERELAGTHVVEAGKLPFPELADWMEIGAVFN